MKRKAGKKARKLACAALACAALLLPSGATAGPEGLGGDAQAAWEEIQRMMQEGAAKAEMQKAVNDRLMTVMKALTKALGKISGGMVKSSGSCYGNDMATEQSLVSYFQNTAAAYVNLVKALAGVAEKEQKLKTIILVDKDRNLRIIEKAGEILVDSTVKIKEAETWADRARSFNPYMDANCGAAMRAYAGPLAARFALVHEEAQRQHAEKEWKAGKTAKDWAESKARKKKRLLEELPKDVEVWSELLFPSDGSYPDVKTEQAGILLAETLGRPEIPPKLAKEDEETMAGAKVNAETTLYNLQTQAALEALQFNVSLHAANPMLVAPVNRMLSEAGLGSGVAPKLNSGTSGQGYSRMQYLEVSAQQTMTVNAIQRIFNGTTVDNMREALHLKQAHLEMLFTRLQVLAHRLGVHVALAGSMAEQGRDESADPRETQQKPE